MPLTPKKDQPLPREAAKPVADAETMKVAV
jgi:hypothetical protein